MNVPVTQPVPPKPPVKYPWVVAAVAALGAGLSVWLGIQEKIEVPTMAGKPVEEARTALPAVKLADRKLAKTITTEEQRLAEAERKNVAREEQERQVTTLMEKAQKALAAGRLTRPKVNSAVTYAQQALQLAPEHAGARQLIADVMEVIINHGREALHKGDLAQAKTYQDEAAALADKYHLPNAQIVGLTHEIALEEQRPTGAPPQQTGQSDMAVQMKKLEERQKELAPSEHTTTG